MTDLRYVGVSLIYQEMVVIALIRQVFICLHRLNFRKESIGRTDVIKTGEKNTVVIQIGIINVRV